MSVKGLNINGVQLADKLRNDFKIEPEMVCSDYVLLITTVCDTDEGFARLVNALQIIDSECSAKELNYNNLLFSQPRIALNPCDCSGKSGDFYRLKTVLIKFHLSMCGHIRPGFRLWQRAKL